MFRSIRRFTHTWSASLAWRRSALLPILLALLAGHFILVQLLTGAQFLDAPRNLHWGLLTWEQPAFLLDGLDIYERIKGFPPDPPELGPLGLWKNPYAGLHSWWGPLAPGLFALVWGASRSYTLLQLVIPLAAGATVLLTYWMGRALIDERAAVVAAIFLSLYPLFREYGSVAYNEALGALVLTGALFAYLRGRTTVAVLLGTLAALTKMDLLALYSGTVALSAFYDRFAGRRELSWSHHIVCLIGPLALAAPWIWGHYLGGGERTPTRGLSFELFTIILPMMVELTFYIPWYGVVLTLGVIGAIIARGLRAGALPRLTAMALGIWLGLGFLVVLIYCATPGAGNSPRIFIPALPSLALLFGAGFTRLPRAWQRRAGLYLGVLFLTINAYVIWYQAAAYGAPIRAAAPAFHELRQREQGFVLTPIYWETILYTRQRATWFEADDVFRDTIMGDAGHFAHYVEQHPIRYVLLPNSTTGPGPRNPAAPAVRAYLDARAERIDTGAWTLWVLPRASDN
ncbi:MAG: glycosyl transferase [Chloroflexaceae bacterium]